MKKIKIKIGDTMHDTGRDYDRELTAHKTLVVSTRGGFSVPVRIVCYMGRSRTASEVLCTIWATPRVRPETGPRVYSGSGRAGGYGYDKRGRALWDALEKAGFETNYSGDWGHVDELLKALGRALGYKGKMLVV